MENIFKSDRLIDHRDLNWLFIHTFRWNQISSNFRVDKKLMNALDSSSSDLDPRDYQKL